MATLVTPVEHKVILHGVSWETYERLLNEHQESPGTHFIYDEGALEIMVLSRRQEKPNRDLAMLVQLVAMESGIDALARRFGLNPPGWPPPALLNPVLALHPTARPDGDATLPSGRLSAPRFVEPLRSEPRPS